LKDNEIGTYMKLINLTGKTALVTGGSRGVGKATVQLLARAGAIVGFCYKTRKNDANQVLRSIEAEGSSGWVHKADLSLESGVLDLFVQVDREFPDGLDIFIANAGIWIAEEVPI